MYPVIPVLHEAGDILEPLGTKFKFWFDSNSTRYLFKLNTPNSMGVTGEDWSEKVACELCELLNLPHAHYDLATWRDQHGVVSPTFAPPDGMVMSGNELLVALEKGYPKGQFYRVRQHTLRLVLQIMKAKLIQVPPDWRSVTGVTSAIDVFVGYLMLDAWIANQDRHHENWAFVISPAPELTIRLAPTFDHASSLGWNVPDQTRIDRLTTRDMRRNIEAYVERAQSAFYTSASSIKPMGTLEVFREAARQRQEAGRAWLDRLAQIPDNTISGLFEQIPPDRITPAGKQFAMRMLEVNRTRLLNLEF